MIVLLPVCHRDIDAATRLCKWLAYLSGEYLQHRTLLIVANHQAEAMLRMSELMEAACSAFGDVRKHVVMVDESGWPRSCNQMFQSGLGYAEESMGGDDVFLLEPDVVPFRPSWITQIENAFRGALESTGAMFMGAFVEKHAPHMSGVGVYGHGWRTIAPKISKADAEPWDTYAAVEIIPHCHFTSLIQHRTIGSPINSLEELSEHAVVYHQCKTGNLIKMLDRACFGGELYGDAGDIIADLEPMPRHFRATNANRLIAGLQFDIYANRAGTALGIYEATDDAHIAALIVLASDPKSGVYPITPEEYAALAKKKPRFFGNANNSNRPIAQVKPTVSLPNAVAASNSPSREPERPAPIFKSVADALKLAPINHPSQRGV